FAHCRGKWARVNSREDGVVEAGEKRARSLYEGISRNLSALDPESYRVPSGKLADPRLCRIAPRSIERAFAEMSGRVEQESIDQLHQEIERHALGGEAEVSFDRGEDRAVRGDEAERRRPGGNHRRNQQAGAPPIRKP